MIELALWKQVYYSTCYTGVTGIGEHLDGRTAPHTLGQPPLGVRPMTPEEEARQLIDRMLIESGWVVQDRRDMDIDAGPGVAIREFPLAGGQEVDYLLYVDGSIAGVIEAKKEGSTLSGVELQSAKYARGLP